MANYLSKKNFTKGVDIQPPMWYYNNRKGKVIEMKEKLEQFFETEKTYVKVGLLHEDDPKRRNEICWYAKQRALGAVDMAQMCGLDYDTAEKMLYHYYDELERMKLDVEMC